MRINADLREDGASLMARPNSLLSIERGPLRKQNTDCIELRRDKQIPLDELRTPDTWQLNVHV